MVSWKCIVPKWLHDLTALSVTASRPASTNTPGMQILKFEYCSSMLRGCRGLYAELPDQTSGFIFEKRGPRHGPRGADHVDVHISWAAPRPDPSHSIYHGPARPITFDLSRPGPAHQHFKFSARPGSARHISETRPGPARCIIIFRSTLPGPARPGPDCRPMTNPVVNSVQRATRRSSASPK